MTFINESNTTSYSKVFNIFTKDENIGNTLQDITIDNLSYNQNTGLGSILYKNNNLNDISYLILNRPQYVSANNNGAGGQNFINTQILDDPANNSNAIFDQSNYDVCNAYIKGDGKFMRPLGDVMYLMPDDNVNNTINSKMRSITQTNSNPNYPVSLTKQCQIFIAMKNPS